MLGQMDGAVNDRTVYRKKHEVVVAILEETTQNAIPLIFSDPVGSTLLGCQSGGNFGERNFGKRNSMCAPASVICRIHVLPGSSA